ncbi:hypothetical protein M0L20_26700 [Spirosoma sp. RP8]|uniref:Beta-lactamase family protein n=1 Tax=Spirosoma liriopis TaxID=2937440 RepID=A0ABT0HTG9_9BACT|nr:hypothetical protein [Spirosoma liriopis]MCK8495484.1 hypothetical protein [Spirosoma liriopis]
MAEHAKRMEELQTTYPRVVTQQDRLFAHDNGIYTHAGITAGIDLALAILEERQGPLFAAKVARELVVYLPIRRKAFTLIFAIT